MNALETLDYKAVFIHQGKLILTGIHDKNVARLIWVKELPK